MSKEKIINFKDILKNTYRINDKGKVYNIKTGERILPYTNKKNGNLYIDLERDINSQEFYPYPIKLNRLVAYHFITKKLDGKVVTFIDFNRKNVKASNLYICGTMEYKTIVKYLIYLNRGDKIDKNKLLSDKEIELVCDYWESHRSDEYILEQLGIRKKFKKYKQVRELLFLIRNRIIYNHISNKYEWDAEPYDSIRNYIEKRVVKFDKLPFNELNISSSDTNRRIYCNAIYDLYGKYSLYYLASKNIKVKKIK